MHRIVLLLLFLIPLKISANEIRNCSNDLKPIIHKIIQLPEACELIQKIEQEGPVCFSSRNHCRYNGLWDANTRTIYIKTSSDRTEGKILRTLLLEMHNALSNRYFTELWQAAACGAIDKESFVKTAEYFEFLHLKKTNALIDKGISQGIFPRDARISLIPDFNAHYAYQQVAGHSQWFSRQYDLHCPPHMKVPFQGTVPHLNAMTPQESKDYLHYFHLCKKLCAERPTLASEKAFHEIVGEKSLLQTILYGQMSNSAEQRKAKRKLEMFNQVFKNIL